MLEVEPTLICQEFKAREIKARYITVNVISDSRCTYCGTSTRYSKNSRFDLYDSQTETILFQIIILNILDFSNLHYREKSPKFSVDRNR